MNEVTKFLAKHPIQYLATMGLDGKPKVRPFQFKLEDGGKLYFSTTNDRNVYQEIKKQPYVEFCTSGENFTWLRLSGKIVFSDDLSIKTRIFEEAVPLIQSFYQSPDNPAFVLFYLDEATATISDLSGNPPKEFKL
ncbi:pyridoxamine 5'-phosphate oxidase family protein [bacterium]|nr:pyridoxamine 5'-phosphate oxidase family protein [bacterium]